MRQPRRLRLSRRRSIPPGNLVRASHAGKRQRIQLALQDGVSAGLEVIRRELAELDKAVAASSERVRRAGSWGNGGARVR